MPSSDSTPQGWWMYQGGPAHGGYVTSTTINSTNVKTLKARYTLQVGGPVLSVPAVVGNYAYVGVANATAAPGNNGGGLFKVNLQTGVSEHCYVWPVDLSQRDTHGFTGMGCTPAVVGGYVYFSAFDGYFYCLNEADLSFAWKTNLRRADPDQNQPATNDFPPPPPESGLPDGSPPADYPTYAPPAAGWSSPVVANGKVYVGMGEGENPQLFGFVYCLDAQTGKVIWIFCTDQLADGVDNLPNQIPAAVVQGPLLPGFTSVSETATYKQPRGGSVWSGIAYANGSLYVTTGNPVGPDPYNDVDHGFPAPWTYPYTPPGCSEQLHGPDGAGQKYTYAVLALDAESGTLQAHYAPTQETSYRPSDGDIDFGGSAAVFQQNGNAVVAVANKNGTIFLLNASDLSLVKSRQMLPFDVNGQQIPSVDPHPASGNATPGTFPTNCESNTVWAENYSGTFGAPAVDTANGLIFVGLGGPNYHGASPGIDYNSTPFMRALKWDTLEDAWPMENYTFTPGNNLPPVTVQRYTASGAGAAMYQNPGEGAIGSPAIANDVVFVGTQTSDSAISLYAFNVLTGEFLWSDPLGMPTMGLNGGYGYCMGPAVCGDYVVAGGLVQGRDGGVLKIYTFA